MAEQLINTAALLAIGYVSAYVGARLKIPTSRLIGPILAVGIVNGLGLNLKEPQYLVLICSVILGINIGLKINKKSVQQIKSLLKPGLIIVCWYVLVTFFYGEILSGFSVLDETTAFLAVVPGGVAEVSILALSYDADLAEITCFQITRILSIFILIPPLIRKFHGGEQDKGETPEAANEGEPLTQHTGQLANWFKLFCVGALGSILFTLGNVPAGRILGAILFTAAYNLYSSKSVAPVPPKWLNFAFIGIGSFIGSSVTRESLITIPKLVFPIILLTVLIIGSSLILAVIYSKIFKWNILTGFLGIVPGGMMPMILIADELNANIVVVSTLQLLRFLTAIIVIPFVYRYFL
ncbi:MAG: AbrB family transcriptional regulator [Peptococcaceae bacterium]